MDDYMRPDDNPQPRRRRLRSRKPPNRGNSYGDADDDDAVESSKHIDQFAPPKKTDLPVDIVLGRLRALGMRITGNGPSWQATCPAHADMTPSLSLSETESGVLLVYCWGGCETIAVLEKLGLTTRHLYPSLFALLYGPRAQQMAARSQGGTRAGKTVEPTLAECDEWMEMLRRMKATRAEIKQLAARLGLRFNAIVALGVGYDEDDDCWIFPERTDEGRVVGLVRRYWDGRKRSMSGGMRGLTIPEDYGERPAGPLYIAEGASDTAALYSVDAFGIGRSNAAGSGAERIWLPRYVGRHQDRKIIVVGDRDANGVGSRGAADLASFLHTQLDRPVYWALPRKPYKDAREQIVDGKWNKGFHLTEVQS